MSSSFHQKPLVINICPGQICISTLRKKEKDASNVIKTLETPLPLSQ